jgi:hypothetical protein
MIVGFVHVSIVGGMLILSAMRMNPKFSDDSEDLIIWIGILSLIFSVTAFILTLLLTKDSPVSLLYDGYEDEALTTMIRLRIESIDMNAPKNEFESLKSMVAEDKIGDGNVLKDGNKNPFAIVILMKICIALAYNYPVNLLLLNLQTAFYTDYSNCVLVAAFGIKFIAVIITVFAIDTYGRRIHFLVSSGGAGLFLALSGVFLFINFNPILKAFTLMIFELLSGFGLGIATDVYSSEAFNVLTKPKSIAYSTMIELTIHILLAVISLFIRFTAVTGLIFCLLCGICMILITTYLHFKLPETAKLSLRDAKNEFLKIKLNIK